jgi:hypothetical protein
MEWPSDDGQRQSEAWICYGMAWQGKDGESKTGKGYELNRTAKKRTEIERGVDNMRTNLVAETTEERRGRLREELEARKATLRIVKGLCLWTSGAAMILSAVAGMAGMTYECAVTGFVALVALLYGLA